jgi:hypothetical protein
MRHFTASFAELAVATNAAVIPIIARMDVGGRICIEFSPPLEPEVEKTARKRAESLIIQYARFLEGKWSYDPASVRMPYLIHFLSLPPAVKHVPPAGVGAADQL